MMEARQSGPAKENGKSQIIELLDRHLATAIDLQLRIKNALWNAEDPRLAEARELNATATDFQLFCHLIAMRLRSLGAVAQASLQRTPMRSFLDPCPFAGAGDEERISMIDRALTMFHKSVKQACENAAALQDQSTAALFAKLAAKVDAQIWFLRSPSDVRKMSGNG